jgi:hypothetical protein
MSVLSLDRLASMRQLRATDCCVRHFELRADRPSGEDYGRSIRVKTNIAQVLRRELERKSWRCEEVSLGSATDPYQPAEGRFQLTRACIVELTRAFTPFSIITRGPLVVLPPRALGLPRPARSRGSRDTRGRSPQHLGERRPSAPRRTRALPRDARRRLARGGAAVRGALRIEGVSPHRHNSADDRAGATCSRRDWQAATSAVTSARALATGSCSLSREGACRSAP